MTGSSLVAATTFSYLRDMKYIIIMAFVLTTLNAIAQKASYKWEDELCLYEGTYDTKKVTKDQLKACYRLALQNDFDINTSPMVFKPEDIQNRLEPEKLEEEFRTKAEQLKKLGVPQTPFWKGLKAAKLKEQQQRYAFNHAAFRAYKEVNALKEYQSKNKAAQRYTTILLAGGNTLLDEWKELRKKMAERNCDPERITREYEARLASPERLNYAFVDVMTFGWFNSANEGIELAADIYPPEMVNKEWKKLFIKTKTIHCDEP